MATIVTALIVLLTVRDNDRTGDPRDDGRASLTARSVGFSIPSGHYDEPVTLTLTGPDTSAEILYTLDGSYPDREHNADATLVYDGPIVITDRSPDPDTISTIPTTILPRSVPWPVAEPPEVQRPVAKATTVRARVADGPVTSAFYMVGLGRDASSLPVVSIAIDAGCLFDVDDGIAVPGRTFSEFRASDAATDLPGRAWQTPANYLQRGRGWECPQPDRPFAPAAVHYCPAQHPCSETFHVGLRVHGNRSRAYAQKSWRLYARHAYGAPGHLGGLGPFDPPFGPHRRLLLRNSGQDHNQLTFLDAFLQSLVTDLAVGTQASEPVAVFINGEYWGRHNLRERYDRHYLAATYGADPDTVVLLGTNLDVEAGSADGAEPWLEILQFVATNDLSDPYAATWVEDRVDLDSFFDAIIVHTYFGNEDWPGNNMRLWRQPASEQPTTSSVLDSRWRFLVFDLDQTAGRRSTRDGVVRPLNADINLFTARFAPSDSITHERGYPLLFHRLMEHDDLSERFVHRYTHLLNTTFASDRVVPLLHAMADTVAPEMDGHIARWGGPASMDQWHRYVARLEVFLQERPEAVGRHLVELFETDDGR